MGFVANVSGVGSFGATVDQQSALLASMAAMGPKGDKGDTGGTGATGPQGPAGTAATIAVGTTSTLAPGASATVANSGTSSAAVFNFGIPEGEKGDKGDTGDTGPQGPQGIPGVVAATAPILYDAPTQTVSIDPAYKPNPFDQSLNTTDEVDFRKINLSDGGIGSAEVDSSWQGNGVTHTVLTNTAGIAAFGGFNHTTSGGSISVSVSGITFPDATVQTTAAFNTPSASTTVAGKVELATDAEAITGTDTSRAITPKNLFSTLFNRSLRLYTGTDLASPSTSSGSTTVTANGIEVATSATTSGAFALRGIVSSNQHPQSIGKGRGVLNFDKPTWIGTRIQRQTTLDANAVIRLSVGKIFTDSKGDLTRRGFGWVIQGSGNFQTQGHNGTSLTKSTNGTTGLSDTNAVDVLCYSDGAGNVKLYVNGIETASSTGGPTGDSTSTANAIIFEIEQVGTATAVSAADCGQIFILQID